MLELYTKELSNIDTKKYNKNKNHLFLDAGLNMIDKKVKEKFSSRITLNNEIKDILKVLSF